MSDMTAAQKDKLMADLKVVIADAEELLRLTAGEVGAGAGDVRMRLQERLARPQQHRCPPLPPSGWAVGADDGRGDD